MIKRLVLIVVVISISSSSGVAEKLVPYGKKSSPRDGFAIGFALGPSAILGIGVEDANATGAGFSLRVGTSAGPRLVWLLQLDGAGYLFNDMADQLATNQFVTFNIAGQWYVSDAFWMKGLVGLANYNREIRSGIKLPEREINLGADVGGGVGIDVYRRGTFALGIEFSANVGWIADGGLVQGRLALGAHFY